MLVLKMAELHGSNDLTSSSFTFFGLLWFFFADFIPRVLPTISFVLLMRTRGRGSNESKSGITQSRGSHGVEMGGGISQNEDAFQFVKLEGDEGDYDLSIDDLEGNSKHENIALGDQFIEPSKHYDDIDDFQSNGQKETLFSNTTDQSRKMKSFSYENVGQEDSIFSIMSTAYNPISTVSSSPKNDLKSNNNGANKYAADVLISSAEDRDLL